MSNAISVAAYIMNRRGVYGNMQLQKLLYYVQAWNLAWTGKPMFSEEIEAWPMGPVVRTVWSAVKYEEPVQADALSDQEKAVVDAVYEFYGDVGGAVLGKWTHNEEPWIEARDGLLPTAKSSAAISQATMRRYFSRRSAQSMPGPKPPVLPKNAGSEEARAAVSRQRQRWREALDVLAER